MARPEIAEAVEPREVLTATARLLVLKLTEAFQGPRTAVRDSHFQEWGVLYVSRRTGHQEGPRMGGQPAGAPLPWSPSSQPTRAIPDSDIKLEKDERTLHVGFQRS